MSRKAYTPRFKMEVLQAWGDGSYTLAEILNKYKVSETAIREWKYRFDTFGSEGLKDSSTWKKYSKDIKLLAVSDYLFGNYSLFEVIRKYEISSHSVLRKWIKKYNSHSELKDTSQGRTITMTKGRKTTWEERMQIVLNCLGNGKDYQETASIYKVSYQQVYQWVKKYEDGGDDALKDRRGNKKEEAKLTPEEKISLQMKKLERENERLRAENLFLKKLEEFERRRK